MDISKKWAVVGQLYGVELEAAWAASDVGKAAIAAYTEALESFAAEYDVKQQREKTASEKIRRLLRDDSVKAPSWPVDVEKNGRLFRLPNRPAMANSHASARRMLRVHPDSAARFIYRCHEVFDEGEAAVECPFDPVTDFGAYSNWEASRMDRERQQNGYRAFARAVAMDFLKWCRDERIPIEVEYQPFNIKFQYGAGPISGPERDILVQALQNSATRCGGRIYYADEFATEIYSFGLAISVTERAFNERYEGGRV